MKTVRVRLVGHVEVFLIEQLNGVCDADKVSAYNYMTDLEDAGIVDGNMYELAFMKEIGELVYIVDNEEVAITKKGKYIKRADYFHCLGLELPFVVQHSDSTTTDFEYEIEIADDAEFDPMKLQLVKSDYEVSWLPYGIVTDSIVYDGVEYKNALETCFDIYSCDECFLYDDFNTCRYIF